MNQVTHLQNEHTSVWKGSLLFPVSMILSGIYWAVLYLIFHDDFYEPLQMLIAPLVYILLGGVMIALPIIKKYPDIDLYFKIRLVFLAFTLLLFSIPALVMLVKLPSAAAHALGFLLLCAPIPLFLGELFFFAVQTKSAKKTALILLSEPLIWNMAMILFTLSGSIIE